MAALAARLLAADAGTYPLVLQRFPEAVGVATPVRDHPFDSGKTALQEGGSGMVADLSCCHEELQRPSTSVSDIMKLGVQATLRKPDQTPALVVGSLFLPAGSKYVSLEQNEDCCSTERDKLGTT